MRNVSTNNIDKHHTVAMLTYRKSNIIAVLVLLITFISINDWSKIPLGNTATTWAILIFTIIYILYYYRHYFKPLNRKDYNIVNIYLIWLLICVIRGCFVAENYWEWKQLISGTISLLLPILVWVFSDKINTLITLNIWVRIALPAFFLFFLWTTGITIFYLAPILLLVCFVPLLSRRHKKWGIFLIIFILVITVSNLGFRSQVIKGGIVICMCIVCYCRKHITNNMIKLFHIFCFVLPVILLYLGISGTFNIFEDLSAHKDKYVQKKVVDGHIIEEDLSADTRTFIFEEVITSAVRHNYVIWGRTPARGNDSMAFGAAHAEDLKTGKYERHSNELCHTNVFTWLGLIGVILYSLIYLKSSYLAIYKSNNIYIKFLGCYIAFHWAFGWIEDQNRFDIDNIILWMIIAMGISTQFRVMTNHQFYIWYNHIFNFKKKNHAHTLAVHQQRTISTR